jgi:hypothetical protein
MSGLIGGAGSSLSLKFHSSIDLMLMRELNVTFLVVKV